MKMKSNPKNNVILQYVDFFVVLTSLISFFICLFNREDLYAGMIMLPLIYLPFYIAIFKNVNIKNTKYRITIYSYLAIQWLRLVCSPAIGSISGYLGMEDMYVNTDTMNLTIILLAWEMIITGSFCCMLLKTRTNADVYAGNFQLKGTLTAYSFFVLVGMIVFVLTGADNFHFFALNLTDVRVAVDTSESVGSGINEIISFALTFLVIVILYCCYFKYQKKSYKKYVCYALICAVFRLCLISSEGRMSQIYLFGTFLMLLPRLFPEHTRLIRNCVFVVAIAVLGLMTVYKTFYAFLYDSYIDAIKANSLDLNLVSSQIDSYFYGLKTIARNISFTKQADISLFQPVFDIFRNTFGIHYLIKGLDYTTIEYYNMFMYGDMTLSGHLFSSIAYGYLHMGLIAAPIITCVNILITCWIEKIIKRIRYIDIYYIVCLIFIRFIMTMFAGIGPTWNVTSRTLVIGFIIIACSSILKQKNTGG